VQDLLELLRNLLVLQGRDFAPKVELHAYCSEELADAELSRPDTPLHFEYQRQVAGFRGNREIETFDADVLLDIAVLQRSGLTAIEPLFKERVARNAVTAVIRSVHRVSAIRRVASAKPVAYHVDSEEKEKTESLRYFLRYLFRKEQFRKGQISILERALARKDVIGLLPTGAGKSLCYQLSALLQPGITLVVDPLKSLMHDQDDHLKEAGIDTTTFIDSSLKKGERPKRIKRFQDGEFQFTFITPERLMIQEFRNALTEMGTGASPKWFAYCVIDEAHCVSEWGHDFRTAYLRLGENARRFCKPASGDLPFIALTGTASFDVLDDVQRELQLEDNEAIVKLDSYERKELHFEIITVQKPQDQPVSKKEREKLAAGQKNLALANLLSKLPQQLGCQSDGNGDFYECNGERTNSGLIFCPHVGNNFGIKEVAAHVRQDVPQLAKSTGIFGSKLEEDDTYPSGYLEEIQRKFKNNELALLVATKSFGMGIDKPNIRYTVHFSMPPSLEAFYQEAGRAGRDHQLAVCALLFSEGIDKDLMRYFHEESFPGEKKEKGVLYLLLPKIEPDQGSHSNSEKTLESMAIGEARWTIRIRLTGIGRSKQETFKAIYRLSVVGAVDDYTIYYHKKYIEATITKHSDDEYVKILTKYVSRFMSRKEAKQVPDKIMQRKGNTVLQKCLGYLIWFVYDRIKKRREEALDVMEQAAKVGAYPNENTEKTKDECTSDFSDFVYNYFDSFYTPELREKLYDYDLDLVWQYIDEVNGEPSPTKNLRGSCDRLLEQNPYNAALLLLRAYARILLAYGEDDILRDLQRGFELFKNQAGHSAAVNAASQFYREVEKQGNLGLSVIASAMSKLHLDWLKKFNRRFEGE
jgi:RecQ family ATP-dependent DNA helicase